MDINLGKCNIGVQGILLMVGAGGYEGLVELHLSIDGLMEVKIILGFLECNC